MYARTCNAVFRKLARYRVNATLAPQRTHIMTSHHDPQFAIDILTRSSLGGIVRKAKWLLNVNDFLQTILPREFTSYCQVMTINQSTLIVGVNNAAIAMRLKFMSDDLMRQLQQKGEFARVKKIEFRVRA